MLAYTAVRSEVTNAHLILKWSLKCRRPDSPLPATLALRFFTSLSFSTSISAQVNTPVHRLTRATFFCEMTELKNSAWRREGVGGMRDIDEVTIRAFDGESYVASNSCAFGGERRISRYGDEV